MSDYRRAYVAGGTYFFTLVTYLRRRTFIRESAVNLLEASIQYVMAKRPFQIDAMEWRHSSFRRFVEKGVYGADWGGNVREVLEGMNLE